jgi:hypothetical protein
MATLGAAQSAGGLLIDDNANDLVEEVLKSKSRWRLLILGASVSVPVVRRPVELVRQ